MKSTEWTFAKLFHWISKNIKENQRKSKKIKENQRKSKKIKENQRNSKKNVHRMYLCREFTSQFSRSVKRHINTFKHKEVVSRSTKYKNQAILRKELKNRIKSKQAQQKFLEKMMLRGFWKIVKAAKLICWE